MILHIHSDASYLSASNARSRLGGLFLCGDKSPQQDNLNGSILNVASVIKNVVAAAAESEVGACFQNAQSGAPPTFEDLKVIRRLLNTNAMSVASYEGGGRHGHLGIIMTNEE
jgi:hypothetical protein